MLAVTLAFCAISVCLSILAARRRARRKGFSGPRQAYGVVLSTMLSGLVFIIGAAWSLLADAAQSSYAPLGHDVLRAWLVLVGPIVSLIAVPGIYAIETELQNLTNRPTDRERLLGFPTAVVVVYASLNIASLVFDKRAPSFQVEPVTYVLLATHCVAIYASWILYVIGMDKWIVLSGAAPQRRGLGA
jgi:hypothetical protein